MSKPTVILSYPKIDHERNYVYFWMPFSLLTIAKPLIDGGLVDVIIFDGNQQSTEKWNMLLKRHINNTLFIGISIMTGGGQIGHALTLAAIAKGYDRCPPVIFGGPHVNVLAEQTLDDSLVDMIVAGPGQNSIPILVECLLRRTSLTEVPGLIAKPHDGKIRGAPNSPRSGQLGRYPWELLDIPRYIRNDPTVNSRTLNYVSSQGCVYKCQFCYELTYQRKYSALSAEVLVGDVLQLVDRYGINGLKFYDADFFVNRNRAYTFSEMLRNLGRSISWAASINPNDILKSNAVGIPLLKSLAESHCTRLLMGVESGSDRILNSVVKKEVTRKQILQVAGEIAAHGILGSYTFILGFPGETAQEMGETLGLIEQLWKLSPAPETRVHIFAPYPGTPLYNTALEAGFVPPATLAEWSNYDYYRAQTPWVKLDLADTARAFTRMTLTPETGLDPDGSKQN